MKIESSAIYLLEVATGRGIEAVLRDKIEIAQLTDWHIRWQPALAAVLQDLERQGIPPSRWPQSRHWNWQQKAERVEGLLGFRGFCVLVEGVTQGLALLDLTRTGRDAAQVGKPLVYIDYLEVAPWNRPDLGRPPQFRGVGTALLTAAVELSEEEGYMGRIGLHSLPQAEDFYRKNCKMTDLGPDPVYQNLRYFEMTAEQARAFSDKE